MAGRPPITIPNAPDRYDASVFDRILRLIETALRNMHAPKTVDYTALRSIPETQATGGGTAGLGTNCPAVTPGAPFTWLKITLADGSAGYQPVWK